MFGHKVGEEEISRRKGRNGYSEWFPGACQSYVAEHSRISRIENWSHNETKSSDNIRKDPGEAKAGFFLGGKTCCAFDCTPNVDTAIEDKMKDRQKATLQATRVIHACGKESLFFFANKLDNVLVRITLVV